MMRFFRGILFVYALGLLVFVFFVHHYPSFGDIKNDDIKDINAIIVPTGAPYRIPAALALAKQNHDKKILITGVHPDTTLHDLDISSSIEPQISIDHHAENTEDNATIATQWLAKHHFKKALIITSDYHMPRILWLLKQKNPDVVFYPLTTQSSITPKHANYTHYQFWDRLLRSYHKFILTVPLSLAKHNITAYKLGS